MTQALANLCVFKGPTHRYPGTYYIYHHGKELDHFSGVVGETKAKELLRRFVAQDPRAGIFRLLWQAADNDPRQGQPWFTNCYKVDEVEQ